MRRRSLFAGLAGLLAAPKVAAAVPVAPLSRGSGGPGLAIGTWTGIRPGQTIRLVTGHDADRFRQLVAKHQLNSAIRLGEWEPPRVVAYGHDTEIPLAARASAEVAGDRIAEAAQPLPQPAHGTIGVAWAGYTSEAP